MCSAARHRFLKTKNTAYLHRIKPLLQWILLKICPEFRRGWICEQVGGEGTGWFCIVRCVYVNFFIYKTFWIKCYSRWVRRARFWYNVVRSWGFGLKTESRLPIFARMNRWQRVGYRSYYRARPIQIGVCYITELYNLFI